MKNDSILRQTDGMRKNRSIERETDVVITLNKYPIIFQ